METIRPGTIIDSRYQLLGQIGEGGMCTVWEARRLDDSELVAIKFLLPELRDEPVVVTRFLREAAVARAGDRSPHVVKIAEVIAPPDGPLGLVMERLEGEDLRDLLNAEQRLGPARAADLIVQVCQGLAELHGQGITHRDLKPENIFVCRDELGADVVKLLDFGIAKFRESPDEHPASFDDDGVISCTPHYAAPELLSRSADADHKVDIYALGVMLYELLTGTRPFRCQTPYDAWVEITFEHPLPPRQLCSDIPEGLEAIMLRAMSKTPEDRFSSVDELAEVLSPFTWTWGEGQATVVDVRHDFVPSALVETVVERRHHGRFSCCQPAL